MLEFGFGFIFGALIGVLISLVGLLIVLFVFLLDTPTEGKSTLEQRIQTTEEEDKIKLSDPSRHWNVYGDKQIRGWNLETRASAPGEEKCEWFNLLKQRVFQVLTIGWASLTVVGIYCLSFGSKI